jgi:hypothetical protein
MKNLLMYILEIAFCLNYKNGPDPVFIPMQKTDEEMRLLMMKAKNSQNKY